MFDKAFLIMAKHFVTYRLFCTLKKSHFPCNKPSSMQFCSSISCHLRQYLTNPFVRSNVRLGPSYINDFTLRDLQTIYIPPYMSILFRDALL